jgi:hypothetical protein
MFEFRLRILDVRDRDTDPPSFLGIVEGFPQIMTHSASVEQAAIDLTNALIQHLQRLQDPEATRLDLDDFPTVRVIRISLGLSPDPAYYRPQTSSARSNTCL